MMQNPHKYHILQLNIRCYLNNVRRLIRGCYFQPGKGKSMLVNALLMLANALLMLC